MSNLYLIDQPFTGSALALAAADADALVVLLQDGVYAGLSPLKAAGRPVFAVKRDVQRRGLEKRLSGAVTSIGFDELVDLIVDHKVVNFA